jgi:hypothetical protein
MAEWRDVATPVGLPRIVAAIRNHAIWPLSWPSMFTLQWRNRVDERQSFLRIVAVGAGQPKGERHAAPPKGRKKRSFFESSKPGVTRIRFRSLKTQIPMCRMVDKGKARFEKAV